jgi:hypothetical protein
LPLALSRDFSGDQLQLGSRTLACACCQQATEANIARRAPQHVRHDQRVADENQNPKRLTLQGSVS